MSSQVKNCGDNWAGNFNTGAYGDNQPVIPPGHQPFPLTPEEIATVQKTRAEAAEKAQTQRSYEIEAMHVGNIRVFLPQINIPGQIGVSLRDAYSYAANTLTLPQARELIEKLGLLIGVAEAGR